MAVAASLLLAVLVTSHATIRIDNAIYDLGMKLHHRTARQDIVIVAIDPASLARVKQWPWPRRTIAGLIGDIAADHPAALACYFLFMFPSSPADDQAIHDAMNRTKTFVPLPRGGGVGPNANKVLTPIPLVASAVQGIGLGDQSTDSDGIVRRAKLSEGENALLQKRIVYEMARLRDPPQSNHAMGARVGFRTVLIPYVGPVGSFTTISALSVIDHRVPTGFFRDKFVLIGATARDLLDDYPTPTSPFMPNVEIDANLLNGLLDHSLVYASPVLETIAVSLAILWVLFVALIRLGPRENLRFAVGIMMLPFVGSVLLLFGANFWIPRRRVSPPSLS